MQRIILAVAAVMILSDGPEGVGQETRPAGNSGRVPWTTSQVTGSPDPLPPLRAERAFPRLTFRRPVALTPFPGGQRYVLVEEEGTLYTFRNEAQCDSADLFIDLRKEILGLEKVEGCRGVRQSFAIAFDPQFEQNRHCYVMYILASKDRNRPLENGSRVSRFRVTSTDPPRIDPASEEILLTWLAGGHNGSDMHFGNDGFLYISTGDGEDPTPPDRRQTGQDISDLLSSVLRIDVHQKEEGRPYAIPPDNPFRGVEKARPEVWCYGLRNPWRMNFDRRTGQLWIGDVGWERWEMIYAAQKGGNYGWSVMEGPRVCLPEAKRGPTPILPPAHAIPHPLAASITGGFVYHGSRLKGFEGWYFYGDWETRRVWANPVQGTALGERALLARTTARIVSWAEEADGELLMVDYEGGGLHRLVANDPVARNTDFPVLLSRTGIFDSVRSQAPAPGVIPYGIHAPAWMDGATGERWLAIPGRGTIQLVDKIKDWPRESVWPKDSVLAKTLSLGPRRLETQVLHFDGQSWNGYSYVWNEAQTDARLAPEEGQEIDVGGGRKWKVLARATCLTCHNPWPGYALTINGSQLGSETLRAFQEWEILPRSIPLPKPFVDPYDERAPVEDRARAYLAVNCGHCHRFGGGGAAKIVLLHDVPAEEMKIESVRPTLGGFDLTDPYLVCGGDPARSVLLFRVSKLGQGRMPHVGSDEVDPSGVGLLRRWIAGLPESPADSPTRQARGADQAALKENDFGRLLSSTTGALELLAGLDGLPVSLRQEAVRRALALPPGMIRDLFETFEPPAQRRVRLGLSIKPETILERGGDPGRGRQVFANPALQCTKCHRVQPGPETVGPDLSKIGSKYSKAQILESILDPSKTIDPKYVASILQTKAGEVLSGIVVSRTETELVLRDPEKETRLPLSAVEKIVPQQKSLMPEGLLQHLTAQEAADLVAFLESLK